MPSRSEDIDRFVVSVAASFDSQVGNLLSRCLEIGFECGSRLGDCQDLGLQPLHELSVGFGPGMKLRDLLGVPGPFGLELGLEVPKLLPELVALSMNAVQPVIEMLDPLVELFGLETGQA